MEGLGSSPTPAVLVDDVSQAHKSSFWASFIQAVRGWVRRRKVSVDQGRFHSTEVPIKTFEAHLSQFNQRLLDMCWNVLWVLDYLLYAFPLYVQVS
jgi:hypothetical protein